MFHWQPEEHFADQAFRLTGLDSWFDAFKTGRGNLKAMHSLAQRVQHEELASEADRAELRARTAVIELLEQAVEGSAEHLPLLPWLRSEHFAVGDSIAVWGTDTPGATPGWSFGTVEVVEKSQKPEWSRARRTAGYYWRVQALVEGWFGESLPARIPFSTTEPRVVLRSEFEQLVALTAARTRFGECFRAASVRDWQPVWCIERNLNVMLGATPSY